MKMMPAPLSARYQVIVLGAGAPARGQALWSSITDRVTEFGPLVAGGLTMLRAQDARSVSAISPAVAVYFGGDTTTDVTDPS
jgi:hypothetical protein